MMRFVAAMCMIVLTGCATTGEGGKAQGINGTGNVVVEGDINILKLFGAHCAEASSGFDASGEGSADVGGAVGADVATRTGELQAQAGSNLIAALAALDTCGSAASGEVTP